MEGLPESGEILHLSEVFMRDKHEMHGKAVRVMGKLTSHDIVQRQATIISAERNDTQSRLAIDTKLIEPFEARLGSTFQFIGELELCAPMQELILHARVVQRIDGVDIAMYYSALEVQREYLKSRQDAGLCAGQSSASLKVSEDELVQRIDGVDIAIYYNALELQREYLKSIQDAGLCAGQSSAR